MRTALLLLALAACATTPKGVAKCPEAPKCLTTPTCTYDSETGCNVCQCSPAGIERGSEPPPGQPPFPR